MSESEQSGFLAEQKMVFEIGIPIFYWCCSSFPDITDAQYLGYVCY